MDSSNGVNLAKAFGYHSVVLAVVFAVLYIPLLIYFLHMALKRPTYWLYFAQVGKKVYIDNYFSLDDSSPTVYT